MKTFFLQSFKMKNGLLIFVIIVLVIFALWASCSSKSEHFRYPHIGSDYYPHGTIVQYAPYGDAAIAMPATVVGHTKNPYGSGLWYNICFLADNIQENSDKSCPSGWTGMKSGVPTSDLIYNGLRVQHGSGRHHHSVSNYDGSQQLVVCSESQAGIANIEKILASSSDIKGCCDNCSQCTPDTALNCQSACEGQFGGVCRGGPK